MKDSWHLGTLDVFLLEAVRLFEYRVGMMRISIPWLLWRHVRTGSHSCQGWLRLAAAATVLPLAVSCSSLRDRGNAKEEDRKTPTLRQRFATPNYEKEFEKESFDAYKAFSHAPRSGYQNASFRSKRFDEISTVVPKKYNTEPFRKEAANENKRKWYNLREKRGREKRTSFFARKRAREEGASNNIYSASRYPKDGDLETVLRRRKSGLSPNIINPEDIASGSRSPTIIRERTLSEGDVRYLLNGR